MFHIELPAWRPASEGGYPVEPQVLIVDDHALRGCRGPGRLPDSV